MAKIKKMMELEENGDEQQFFPQTHADAVLDLHEYLKKYVIPGAINGKDGKDGTNGLSAYDIAVLQGFQGTATDWIRSLKGDKGDKGDKGEVGATGPRGLTGETGPQGIQGPKGDTGATGARGPQGIQGPKGDKGERGDSGVIVPVNGFFTLTVDKDGNLWSVSSGSEAPMFSLDDDGSLYYVTNTE